MADFVGGLYEADDEPFEQGGYEPDDEQQQQDGVGEDDGQQQDGLMELDELMHEDEEGKEEQEISSLEGDDATNQQGGRGGRGRGGRGRGRGGRGTRGGRGGRGRGGGHGGRGRGNAPPAVGAAPVIRAELVNPVTLQEMADGVVDKGVYSKYCNDIIHFATWAHDHEVGWFTEYGLASYEGLHLLQEDERRLSRRKRIKAGWMALLRNARQSPIFFVDTITPARVMEGWISKHANQATLKPLSATGYSGKRTLPLIHI